MKTSTHDGWTDCPRGELGQLASRLRLRTFYRQAGLAVAVLATASISVFSATRLTDTLLSSMGVGGAACGSASGCGGCGTAAPTPEPQAAPNK